MRSFLNDLFGVLRTAKSAAPARQVTRRASLQAELLEDRLVPTTAILNGSILTINIPQNQAVVLESNGASQRQMEVFDNGTLLKFNQALNISAITAVNITVAGGDNVFIDDSNGMPFAQNTYHQRRVQGSGNTVRSPIRRASRHQHRRAVRGSGDDHCDEYAVAGQPHLPAQ